MALCRALLTFIQVLRLDMPAFLKRALKFR